MRIAFVIDGLGAGGAQRVLVNMANYWAQKRHAIEILTLEPKGMAPFYQLDESVVYRPLSETRDSNSSIEYLTNNLRRTRVMRKAIRRSAPDVVISLVDRMNVLALLASIGLGIPVVVCEHSDPAQHQIGGRGIELLRELLYRRADSVVMLTKTALSYFGPGIRRRGVVMPNWISLPTKAEGAASGRTCHHKVISVGRLSEEKGFDFLIQAFAKVRPEFPVWSLTIWGEGEQRTKLEVLRDRLGLRECVQLPGVTKVPFKEMTESDLFVSSSRYEGFPMVVLEAMACNLPVVAFDCPSGNREIIRHEVDGLLVPPQDVDALAGAMSRLMGNAALRNQLAKRAGEVVQRFDTEKVMAQWEELLGKILCSSTPRLWWYPDTRSKRPC